MSYVVVSVLVPMVIKMPECSGPEFIKNFMLNSAEHENFPTHKC